jgi:hypothetical protein
LINSIIRRAAKATAYPTERKRGAIAVAGTNMINPRR